MSKSWNTPELSIYGKVEHLTQVTKYLGSTDSLNVSVDLTSLNHGVQPIGS
ncbi:MAG: hypothetical protein ACR9NN_18100 [Nostochopsis sp.]